MRYAVCGTRWYMVVHGVRYVVFYITLIYAMLSYMGFSLCCVVLYCIVL